MKLGLVADIHGDLAGFRAALDIFVEHGIDRLICAGDIIDRGPDADAIVRLLQAHNAVCIKGNHEHTVLRQQERWRSSAKQERLRELGRIINDETAAFIEVLPETVSVTYESVRILVAHGMPWSDVLGLFPDSRPTLFQVLAERVGNAADLVILGHTHTPMDIQIGDLRVVNPGSIYGVTIRDSNTCATLSIPDGEFTVYDLESQRPVPVPQM